MKSQEIKEVVQTLKRGDEVDVTLRLVVINVDKGTEEQAHTDFDVALYSIQFGECLYLGTYIEDEKEIIKIERIEK